jgi:hypothetical protein
MRLPAYWKVGDTTYNSDIAAYLAATSTQQNPQFVIGAVNDGPLWRSEPPESVFTYIDAVTRDIASKYDKIILMYSGGTDSHTVLDSFVRCGLRDVEICMNNTEDHRGCPDRATTNSWATDVLKSDYKYLFTDYGYTFNDRTEEGKVWNNITKDEMDEALHTYSGSFQSQIVPSYGGAKYPPSLHITDSKKTAVVWGLEKPHIRVEEGWLCWSMSSVLAEGNNLGPNVDFDNVYFYLSEAVPELQIKISWLMMKETVSILKEVGLEVNDKNLNFIQDKYRSFNIYNRINKACGYKAASLILDSAASKISPTKRRSNATAMRAFKESGLMDVAASFSRQAYQSIDPHLWNSATGYPKAMRPKSIKLKEVY